MHVIHQMQQHVVLSERIPVRAGVGSKLWGRTQIDQSPALLTFENLCCPILVLVVLERLCMICKVKGIALRNFHFLCKCCGCLDQIKISSSIQRATTPRPCKRINHWVGFFRLYAYKMTTDICMCRLFKPQKVMLCSNEPKFQPKNLNMFAQLESDNPRYGQFQSRLEPETGKSFAASVRCR